MKKILAWYLSAAMLVSLSGMVSVSAAAADVPTKATESIALVKPKSAPVEEKVIPKKSGSAAKATDPVAEKKTEDSVKAVPLTPAQELTAAQIYQQASEKTAALNSMQAKVVGNMKMTVAGSSLDMKMNLDLKMKTGKNKLQMAVKGTANLLDQKVAVNYYYKNGYYYMNMGDQKVKTKMNFDEMMESVALFTPNTSDYLTILSSKKSGTDTIINYQINQNVMKKYIDQVLGTMAGDLTQGMNFAMGPISGVATVSKDGYITDDVMNMNFSLSAEGQKIDVAMVMDCSYVNIGKTISITFPSDLNSYKLMDDLAAAK